MDKNMEDIMETGIRILLGLLRIYRGLYWKEILSGASVLTQMHFATPQSA